MGLGLQPVRLKLLMEGRSADRCRQSKSFEVADLQSSRVVRKLGCYGHAPARAPAPAPAPQKPSQHELQPERSKCSWRGGGQSEHHEHQREERGEEGAVG